MRVDADGWLVADPGDPPVVIVTSVRSSRLLNPLVGVCWHWTGPVSDVRALVARVAKPVPPGGRAASWHLLLARDGTIYQSVALNRASWHAGAAWPNARLVGVETECWGRVYRVAGRWYGWATRVVDGRVKFWPVYQLPRPPVQAPDGRWYDPHTPEQHRSAIALVPALAQAEGWGREAFLHGHSDYSKSRIDPGPLWRAELPAMLDAAFGAAGR